ncbi:hypothetical protein FDZ74_13830 [bacterium]|nr:MAG: hypothetical protein FDZ74_13830 [bacterium]
MLEPGCDSSRSALPGYEDWSVPTAAGYSLPAWWRAGANGAAVILLPGNGGSRDTLLPDAEILSSHGYGVLSLSPRACLGLRSTLGLREAADLKSAAALVARQPGVEWIAVLGFSAGGTAAILGALDTPQIRAVIAEGHFRSLEYEIENSRPAPLSTEWQAQRWIELWYRLRSSAWPAQVSPIDTLPGLQPRPVLLVFGEREADNAGAADQLAAAGPSAELWIVPGAGHGGYLQANPREYEARLLGFLESARLP